VAGELTRRGYMASVTLRNSDSIDIHASKIGEHKLFLIQVKTTQNSKRAWQLTKKSESLQNPNLFYVFVLLKGIQERPDYFIVPSLIVANYTRKSHANWLATPGKNGQAHNDNNMRIFDDEGGKYLERWDLIQ
jgi:hypothetical protein